jgi:hypothetical protein
MVIKIEDSPGLVSNKKKNSWFTQYIFRQIMPSSGDAIDNNQIWNYVTSCEEIEKREGRWLEEGERLAGNKLGMKLLEFDKR